MSTNSHRLETIQRRIDYFNQYRDKNNNCIFTFDDNDKIKKNNLAKIWTRFSGVGNCIFLHENISCANLKIILGNNSFCIVEKSKYCINNLTINNPYGANNYIYINKDFQCHGARLLLSESNNIIIDEDCMFSTDINIWCTDGHAIFDDKNNCINHGEDVFIHKHVWIGHDAEILKGVEIPSGVL